VRLLQTLGDETPLRGDLHPLERGRLGLQRARPHVGPDHARELDARGGLQLDAAAHAGLFGFRRELHALPPNLVVPPVVWPAQLAFLVAPDPERHAPVGAEPVGQADAPLRVPEGDWLLAQELHAHGRAVALGELLRQQRWYPVAPEEIADQRAGTGADQLLV